MTQKNIVLSIILFFILSSIFLAYSEKQQHTLEGQWFLYFQNAKSNNLDFTIENYTNNKKFTWELNCNDRAVQGNSTNINKNDKKTFLIYSDTLKSLDCQKKEIIVYLENEKKTIYKFTKM